MHRNAGWSSQVARRAHNPEVAGSNPAPATLSDPLMERGYVSVRRRRCHLPLPELPGGAIRGRAGARPRSGLAPGAAVRGRGQQSSASCSLRLSPPHHELETFGPHGGDSQGKVGPWWLPPPRSRAFGSSRRGAGMPRSPSTSPSRPGYVATTPRCRDRGGGDRARANPRLPRPLLPHRALGVVDSPVAEREPERAKAKKRGRSGLSRVEASTLDALGGSRRADA